MIRISCTNCKTILSIDDAFAGGVCRCQHCGTIQTVPVNARESSGANVSGQSMGGSRAIAPPDSSASGLDDLAGIVASSGLAGSGLTSGRLKTKPVGVGAATTPARKSQTAMFIAIGVVIVALVGVIVWLAMRPGAAASTAAHIGASANPPEITSPTVASNKPNFSGIPLEYPTVVYLIDRGSGTRELFGALKDATLKSAASLGGERKFAIVFWNNGSSAAYPDGSTTFASADNIASARKAIDDVSAFGASDAVPALQQALALSPDVVVIATAKGDMLDDQWTKSLLDARGTSAVKIDCINLGSPGSGNALKTLASKTGGDYKDVSDTDLRTMGGN